jgi:hypothetical protein
MADEQQVKEREQEEPADERSEEGSADAAGGPESEAQQKAQESAAETEKAEEEMRELEGKEEDELPRDLEEWPDGKAKYITFGGQEGQSGYEDGPTKKLGPSSLRRHEDGEVSIEGEKVDNPDDYKGDPIPGGPTDPNTADLPGEARVKEKQERHRKERQKEAEASGQKESDESGEAQEREKED